MYISMSIKYLTLSFFSTLYIVLVVDYDSLLLWVL